jgi:hypothetical protein
MAEREIKGSGWLLFVVLEKPLYEICLIRIKEHVGEKRGTVCAHRYADCLLKNIANMLSMKNASILMISVSKNWRLKMKLCEKER